MWLPAAHDTGHRDALVLVTNMMEHRFPVVPGKDFAGIVDALGPGVSDYQVRALTPRTPSFRRRRLPDLGKPASSPGSPHAAAGGPEREL